VFFNENNAYAAQWLRNVWPGATVDERSIIDLRASDVADYRAVHLFAGIGGWEYVLQLAGWPSDSPVWTGSCPCQPFSSAGRIGGVLDERHLWPAFHRLIAECRPPVVFGEQVASRAGRAWLAGVRTDLEALGYAVGAADLCAASVGAPHIRQRLFWVADADECGERRDDRANKGQAEKPPGLRASVRLAHAEVAAPGTSDDVHAGESHIRDGGGLGDANRDGTERSRRAQHLADAASSPWSDAIWLPCLDGKARRTQSGIRPLADGIPGRVGRLRAYGNAIVPQVAAAFVRAYMEARRC